MANRLSALRVADTLLTSGSTPLLNDQPEELMAMAKKANAIFFNAVGQPKAVDALVNYRAQMLQHFSASGSSPEAAPPPLVVTPSLLWATEDRLDRFVDLMEGARPDVLRATYPDLKLIFDDVQKHLSGPEREGVGRAASAAAAAMASKEKDGDRAVEEVAAATAGVAAHFGCIVCAAGPIDVFAEPPSNSNSRSDNSSSSSTHEQDTQTDGNRSTTNTHAQTPPPVPPEGRLAKLSHVTETHQLARMAASSATVASLIAATAVCAPPAPPGSPFVADFFSSTMAAVALYSAAVREASRGGGGGPGSLSVQVPDALLRLSHKPDTVRADSVVWLRGTDGES